MGERVTPLNFLNIFRRGSAPGIGRGRAGKLRIEVGQKLEGFFAEASRNVGGGSGRQKEPFM